MSALQAIREMPYWLFWPLVLAGLGAVFAIARFFSKHWPSDAMVAEEALRLAARMDGVGYFVQKVRVSFPFGLDLKLRTADRERRKTNLRFWRRHPDYLLARSLAKLDRIEFEFVDQPLPGLSPLEICSYLRLKA